MYDEARGDQCDNCGKTYDATDLIEPRSKLSGATPQVRETEHFYFRYSDFTDEVGAYLADKGDWRPHVLNFVRSWVEEEGLLDRATVLGERLRAGLQSLADDGLYADLRGDGFVYALVTHNDQPPIDVRWRALDEGVIVRPMADCIGFCPPLVCTEAQIDQLVDAAAAAAR